MRLLQSCTAHHLCAAVEHPVILHRHLARLRVHEAPAHSGSSGERCHACARSVIAYLQNQSGICLSTGLTSLGAQHPEALGAPAARKLLSSTSVHMYVFKPPRLALPPALRS